MKKIAVALTALMLSMNIGYAQKIKGSDTTLPLSQEVAELYMKTHKGTNVIVTGGGSGVGIASLLEGTTDIAMASREMKFKEKNELKKKGKPFKEVIVAYDALTVIVNPKNPVSKLTREQLEGIFTGKITNWKEVGGKDMKIVVYSRESSSGTYEFFKENVLLKKNYMPSILSLPATGAIVQSVSQTEGSIGYIGLAYLDRQVKGLSVSYNGGKTYVAPSVANARNKTYPIVRPLYYYYLAKDEAKVSSFVKYITGKEGQKTASKLGFIPLY